MKQQTIIVDSREQNPLWKKNTKTTPIKINKLDTGDYSLEGEEQNIAIERKSLPDLFGTLGRGHQRFKKEIQRGLKMKYFAIVIEGSITACLDKDFEGSYHTRMKGHVILNILTTIHLKYGVPFFFTNGRIESKRLIKQLLNNYQKVYKQAKTRE